MEKHGPVDESSAFWLGTRRTDLISTKIEKILVVVEKQRASAGVGKASMVEALRWSTGVSILQPYFRMV